MGIFLFPFLALVVIDQRDVVRVAVFKAIDEAPVGAHRQLRSCAKAEGFRDSAEKPVDGPDLRAMRGDARGNELSIDEADAFGKQAASFEHVSHVHRAYGW